jgi:hypothetical protein
VGSLSKIYQQLERVFALKMHTAAILYCAPVSTHLNIGYSILNSSKAFIK